MNDTLKDFVDAILFTTNKDTSDISTKDLSEILLVEVWENLPDSKKEVITHACGRNYYNTSTYEMSDAMCYIYDTGIEYVFEGTRAGFNLFVTTDGFIGRKKNGTLMAKYDMDSVLGDLDFENFTYEGKIDTNIDLDSLYDIDTTSVDMYTSLSNLFINSYKINGEIKSSEYSTLVRRIENNSLGSLIDAYGDSRDFNIESTRKGYELTISTNDHNIYTVDIESFKFFPIRGADLYEDKSDVEDNRMALINMDIIEITTKGGYDSLDGLDNISSSELINYLNDNYAPFTYTQFNDTVEIKSSYLGKVVLGSRVLDNSRLVKEIVW